MKIAAISVAVLVAVVAALAAWLGMFSSVTVVEEEVGPLAFVYVQEATTDFSKIGKITTELGERLEQAGLTQRKPAQLYFPVGRGIQNQIAQPGNKVAMTVAVDELGWSTDGILE